MENQNNQLETINQYIDMDIVEFTEKVTATKNFTETHSMIKLMEMEQSRLIQCRDLISLGFAEVKTNSTEFETLFTKYVGTFVLEQKIIDRKAILEHLVKIKGAQNVMSPKAERSCSATSSEPSGRTCTSNVIPVSIPSGRTCTSKN